MSTLYGTIGRSTPDQLLAKVEADPIAINLMPGAGEVKRGTLLYKNANGFYQAAASAQVRIFARKSASILPPASLQ